MKNLLVWIVVASTLTLGCKSKDSDTPAASASAPAPAASTATPAATTPEPTAPPATPPVAPPAHKGDAGAPAGGGATDAGVGAKDAGAGGPGNLPACLQKCQAALAACGVQPGKDGGLPSFGDPTACKAAFDACQAACK